MADNGDLNAISSDILAQFSPFQRFTYDVAYELKKVYTFNRHDMIFRAIVLSLVIVRSFVEIIQLFPTVLGSASGFRCYDSAANCALHFIATPAHAIMWVVNSGIGFAVSMGLVSVSLVSAANVPKSVPLFNNYSSIYSYIQPNGEYNVYQPALYSKGQDLSSSSIASLICWRIVGVVIGLSGFFFFLVVTSLSTSGSSPVFSASPVSDWNGGSIPIMGHVSEAFTPSLFLIVKFVVIIGYTILTLVEVKDVQNLIIQAITLRSNDGINTTGDTINVRWTDDDGSMDRFYYGGTINVFPIAVRIVILILVGFFLLCQILRVPFRSTLENRLRSFVIGGLFAISFSSLVSSILFYWGLVSIDFSDSQLPYDVSAFVSFPIHLVSAIGGGFISFVFANWRLRHIEKQVRCQLNALTTSFNPNYFSDLISAWLASVSGDDNTFLSAFGNIHHEEDHNEALTGNLIHRNSSRMFNQSRSINPLGFSSRQNFKLSDSNVFMNNNADDEAYEKAFLQSNNRDPFVDNIQKQMIKANNTRDSSHRQNRASRWSKGLISSGASPANNMNNSNFKTINSPFSSFRNRDSNIMSTSEEQLNYIMDRSKRDVDKVLTPKNATSNGGFSAQNLSPQSLIIEQTTRDDLNDNFNFTPKAYFTFFGENVGEVEPQTPVERLRTYIDSREFLNLRRSLIFDSDATIIVRCLTYDWAELSDAQKELVRTMITQIFIALMLQKAVPSYTYLSFAHVCLHLFCMPEHCLRCLKVAVEGSGSNVDFRMQCYTLFKLASGAQSGNLVEVGHSLIHISTGIQSLDLTNQIKKQIKEGHVDMAAHEERCRDVQSYHASALEAVKGFYKTLPHDARRANSRDKIVSMRDRLSVAVSKLIKTEKSMRLLRKDYPSSSQVEKITFAFFAQFFPEEPSNLEVGAFGDVDSSAGDSTSSKEVSRLFLLDSSSASNVDGAKWSALQLVRTSISKLFKSVRFATSISLLLVAVLFAVLSIINITELSSLQENNDILYSTIDALSLFPRNCYISHRLSQSLYTFESSFTTPLLSSSLIPALPTAVIAAGITPDWTAFETACTAALTAHPFLTKCVVAYGGNGTLANSGSMVIEQVPSSGIIYPATSLSYDYLSTSLSSSQKLNYTTAIELSNQENYWWIRAKYAMEKDGASSVSNSPFISISAVSEGERISVLPSIPGWRANVKRLVYPIKISAATVGSSSSNSMDAAVMFEMPASENEDSLMYSWSAFTELQELLRQKSDQILSDILRKKMEKASSIVSDSSMFQLTTFDTNLNPVSSKVSYSDLVIQVLNSASQILLLSKTNLRVSSIISNPLSKLFYEFCNNNQNAFVSLSLITDAVVEHTHQTISKSSNIIIIFSSGAIIGVLIALVVTIRIVAMKLRQFDRSDGSSIALSVFSRFPSVELRKMARAVKGLKPNVGYFDLDDPEAADSPLYQLAAYGRKFKRAARAIMDNEDVFSDDGKGNNDYTRPSATQFDPSDSNMQGMPSTSSRVPSNAMMKFKNSLSTSPASNTKNSYDVDEGKNNYLSDELHLTEHEYNLNATSTSNISPPLHEAFLSMESEKDRIKDTNTQSQDPLEHNYEMTNDEQDSKENDVKPYSLDFPLKSQIHNYVLNNNTEYINNQSFNNPSPFHENNMNDYSPQSKTLTTSPQPNSTYVNPFIVLNQTTSNNNGDYYKNPRISSSYGHNKYNNNRIQTKEKKSEYVNPFLINLTTSTQQELNRRTQANVGTTAIDTQDDANSFPQKNKDEKKKFFEEQTDNNLDNPLSVDLHNIKHPNQTYNANRLNTINQPVIFQNNNKQARNPSPKIAPESPMNSPDKHDDYKNSNNMESLGMSSASYPFFHSPTNKKKKKIFDSPQPPLLPLNSPTLQSSLPRHGSHFESLSASPSLPRSPQILNGGSRSPTSVVAAPIFDAKSKHQENFRLGDGSPQHMATSSLMQSSIVSPQSSVVVGALSARDSRTRLKFKATATSYEPEVYALYDDEDASQLSVIDKSRTRDKKGETTKVGVEMNLDYNTVSDLSRDSTLMERSLLRRENRFSDGEKFISFDSNALMPSGRGNSAFRVPGVLKKNNNIGSTSVNNISYDDSEPLKFDGDKTTAYGGDSDEYNVTFQKQSETMQSSQANTNPRYSNEMTMSMSDQLNPSVTELKSNILQSIATDEMLYNSSMNSNGVYSRHPQMVTNQSGISERLQSVSNNQPITDEKTNDKNIDISQPSFLRKCCAFLHRNKPHQIEQNNKFIPNYLGSQLNSNMKQENSPYDISKIHANHMLSISTSVDSARSTISSFFSNILCFCFYSRKPSKKRQKGSSGSGNSGDFASDSEINRNYDGNPPAGQYDHYFCNTSVSGSVASSKLTGSGKVNSNGQRNNRLLAFWIILKEFFKGFNQKTLTISLLGIWIILVMSVLVFLLVGIRALYSFKHLSREMSSLGSIRFDALLGIHYSTHIYVESSALPSLSDAPNGSTSVNGYYANSFNQIMGDIRIKFVNLFEGYSDGSDHAIDTELNGRDLVTISTVNKGTAKKSTLGFRFDERRDILYSDYCFSDTMSLSYSVNTTLLFLPSTVPKRQENCQTRPMRVEYQYSLEKGYLTTFLRFYSQATDLYSRWQSGDTLLSTDVDGYRNDLWWLVDVSETDMLEGSRLLGLTFVNETAYQIHSKTITQWILFAAAVIIVFICSFLFEFALRKKVYELEIAMIVMRMLPARLLFDYNVFEINFKVKAGADEEGRFDLRS